MLRAAEGGLYLDLELSEPQFYLPDDVEPFCLWAEFAFRHSPDSGIGFTGRCASHLALRADAGFINKVRYTYPGSEGEPNDGSERLLTFMAEWTAVVQAVGSLGKSDLMLVASGSGPQWPS